MKIVFTADLHLGSGYHCGREVDYEIEGQIFRVNSRLVDFYNSFLQVIKTTISIEAKLLILAGDIFKTKNPSTLERYFFTQALKYLRDNSKVSVQVLCIRGNHDGTLTTLSALRPESSISKNFFTVCDTYKALSVDDNCIIHLLPWGETIGKTHESLLSTSFNLLVGHMSVEGATIGYFDSIVTDERVKPVDLTKFDLSILGHIHKPQSIGDSIYYTGSPDKIDFAEKDDQKRFLVFDTSTKLIESCPIQTRQMVQVECDFTKTPTLGEFPNYDSETLVKVEVIYDVETKQRALLLLEKIIQPKQYLFSLKCVNTRGDVKVQGQDYSSTIIQYIDSKIKDPILNQKVKQKSLEVLNSSLQ